MQFEFFKISKKIKTQQLEKVIKYKNWNFKLNRQPKFRSLQLKVESNGTLVIKCNKSTTHNQIIKFIDHNASWVEQKIERSKAKIKMFELKAGLEGESYLFLGIKRNLVIKKNINKNVKVKIFGSQLILEGNVKNCFHCLRAIRRFYKVESESILKEIIFLRSKEMGLQPKKIIFRRQKTLWGSCSADGVISLNWKLVLAPVKVIDYVVVHELAHLKYLNHSVDFWNLVEQFTPHHSSHKKWLSQNLYEFDFLAKNPSLFTSKLKQ